ncbi:MAG: hypothetical protein K2X93_06535 [Candidatus Obscuribacterales bacterium]|nr:hypothetical protein [Candidatus Obscuribacterales bacterium]
MTNSTDSEEDLMWISGFGPIPFDMLDVAKHEHELRVYSLSEASTKTLRDTLAFAAQFSSDEVFTAYADITNDEAYFTFEIRGNTRPQTLSLRYMADRWSAVESHGANSTSARKAGASTKTRVKTVYHAFLDADLVSKVSNELRVTPDEISLIRINFKERTFSLVAQSDKANALPGESIQSSLIPRVESTTDATMTPAEQSPTNPSDEANSDGSANQEKPSTEANANQNIAKSEGTSSKQEQADATPKVVSNSDPSQEVTADFTPDLIDAAAGFASASAAMASEPMEPAIEAEKKDSEEPEGREIKTFQSHPGKDAPQKVGRPAQSSEKVSFEPPKQSSVSSSGAAKYDTYSRSEVERLIKKSAENVTTTVTSKMNAHQKSLKEGLNNHEFAVKQSVEKLKLQVEEATKKLNSATTDLNSKSEEHTDQFKTSLKKEMDEFRCQMSKNMSPTIKALEAKLEQLNNDAKKKVDVAPKSTGPSRGLLIGVMLAVGLAVINLIVGYFAFERISALEKENAKLMTKTGSPTVTDVPIPDLMKEQMDKEAANP